MKKAHFLLLLSCNKKVSLSYEGIVMIKAKTQFGNIM